MAIKVVGLTGGIGSGKSAAADRFAELGVPVVDTDAIAHELTGPHGAAMPALAAAFGAGAVRADGALDRGWMRERVFADAGSRQRLESVLHPLIRQQSEARVAEARGPYCVLVVPLLFETGHYLPMLARTLLVDCEESAQLERVMRRNGMDENAVRAIMAAQCSRVQRRERADDIICNNDSLAALRLQVDAKHDYYLASLADRS